MLVQLLRRSFLMLPVIAQHGDAQQFEDPAWSVKQLVEYHQQHHPVLRVQDVYKLFYQGSFGVEHILSDSSTVASNLCNELESLDSSVLGEPLLERISLDNQMVRVNLRPFKALNLDPSILVKVMFQSARETIADTIMFYRQWNEFSALVRFGLLVFSSDDLKEWDAKVEMGIMQVVHHSPEYTAANKPAYRVVRRRIYEATFGRMKG